MTDSIIRRFRIEGNVADDRLFIQLRQTYYNTIIGMMKDQGYVPLLDIDPVWKTSYDVSNEIYNCAYTWHGVYVGEGAWDFSGAIGQKLIPTQPNK